MKAASSAATEHGTAPPAQSTVVANIVFVNIDWNKERHNAQRARHNLAKLADTTSSIVRNMKPAVICCCEAGTASEPMTSKQFTAMADTMSEAWRKAVIEPPAISFLFSKDAPYLTIWDGNRCSCTQGRILEKV